MSIGCGWMNKAWRWVQLAAIAPLVMPGMALAGISGAAEPTAVPIAPSGKWVVQFEADMCVASRSFGEGSDPFTLAFRPFPTQQEMEVITLEPLHGSGDVQTGAGEIMLDPGGRVAPVTYKRFGLPNHRMITHITAERALLTTLAGATTMTIDLGRRHRTVALTATKALMATLHRCEVQLLTGWGVDPNQFFGASIPVPVEGNPGRWFNSDAYPVEAMNRHEQGRVVALLTIDATGRVIQCRVVTSSKSQPLDTRTCEVANHIRYTPAHDANGKTVASWSVLPVVWQMPG